MKSDMGNYIQTHRTRNSHSETCDTGVYCTGPAGHRHVTKLINSSSPIFYLFTLINYTILVANERIKCPTSNPREDKPENVIYLPFYGDFSPAKQKQHGPLRGGSPTYFYNCHNEAGIPLFFSVFHIYLSLFHSITHLLIVFDNNINI